MQLNDILTRQFTDAEYLEHQRVLHKERCDKAIAFVKKDAGNEELIGKMKKEAEYSMKNLFCIPGSRGLRIDVGTPPRWSDSITDDEEGLWVLNRTHYFNDLTKLYHLSFAKAYRREYHRRRVSADKKNVQRAHSLALSGGRHQNVRLLELCLRPSAPQ